MSRDTADSLRQHGLHVTAQRLAVLRAVAEHCHSTADEVAALVRADIGAISRQAVYDALTALVEAGLLRRIQPAGSPARFETRTGDNHHHLICRACGRTVDVDCAVGHAPCLTPADDAGFRVDEAEVVYWGTCPSCLATAEHASPDGEPATADQDRGSPPPPSGNPRAKARLRPKSENHRREP